MVLFVYHYDKFSTQYNISLNCVKNVQNENSHQVSFGFLDF